MTIDTFNVNNCVGMVEITTHVLATFGHEGERTALLITPISTDKRMSKVVMPYRLKMNHVYEGSQTT